MTSLGPAYDGGVAQSSFGSHSRSVSSTNKCFPALERASGGLWQSYTSHMRENRGGMQEDHCAVTGASPQHLLG